MKRADLKCVVPALLLAALAACTSGPNYVRPAVETPTAFKEQGNWKPAEPRDLEARGKWWEMYRDPLLSSLQEQVNVSNQNLARAEAQYRQALALAQSARAGYFPSVTGGISESRSRASATTVEGAPGEKYRWRSGSGVSPKADAGYVARVARSSDPLSMSLAMICSRDSRSTCCTAVACR